MLLLAAASLFALATATEEVEEWQRALNTLKEQGMVAMDQRCVRGAAASCASILRHMHFDTQEMWSHCADPLQLSKLERRRQRLRGASVQQAVARLRECGFVRISKAVDPSTAQALMLSIYDYVGKQPDALYSLRNAVGGGSRVEVMLPFASPFNESALHAAPLFFPVVRPRRARHSIHASVSACVLTRCTGDPAGSTCTQVKTRMGERRIVMEDATCLITKTTEHAQPPHSDVQPWHAHLVAGIVPPDDVPALEADEATYQVVAQLQLVATTPDYGVLHVCPATHNDYLKSDGMTAKFRYTGQPGADIEMEQLLAEHCPFPIPTAAEQGDVVLYDARIIHWGGANARAQNRPVVAWTFSLPWYADPYNTGRPRNKQREQYAPQWMSVEL